MSSKKRFWKHVQKTYHDKKGTRKTHYVKVKRELTIEESSTSLDDFVETKEAQVIDVRQCLKCGRFLKKTNKVICDNCKTKDH